MITDQNADANQAWSLDPVGNWSQFKWDTDGGGGGTPITQTRAHNTANEIAGNGGNPISGTGAANWVDPAYDPAGNMTAGPQPRYETVDANTQLYKYDAWNRLTKIYQDANCNDTIDDPSELVVTYSYDGQNRRIRKVLAVPNPDITYDYYYNESWQVLEVRKGGDTDPLEQYVWGVQYVDAPVVRFRDGNVDGDLLDTQDNTDSTLYYTYDGNFNVTAVIKPDGTVAERYTYDPYGKVTFKAADWSDAASQAKSAYDNEVLYCGYRWDPESGNYIARRRYLTPPLGRWLTPDPIGYGDGMNGYQYVGSCPIPNLDPSGLKMIEFLCCTEPQIAIIQAAHNAAQSRLNVIEAAITEYTYDWVFKNYAEKHRRASKKGEESRIGVILTTYRRAMQLTIKKMQDKFAAGIGAKCEEVCPTVNGVVADAYVRAFWGYGTFGYIHFCPPFFSTPSHPTGSIFLHELSHLAADTHDRDFDWWGRGSQKYADAADDAYWFGSANASLYETDVYMAHVTNIWGWLWPVRY